MCNNILMKSKYDQLIKIQKLKRKKRWSQLSILAAAAAGWIEKTNPVPTSIVSRPTFSPRLVTEQLQGLSRRARAPPPAAGSTAAAALEYRCTSSSRLSPPPTPKATPRAILYFKSVMHLHRGLIYSRYKIAGNSDCTNNMVGLYRRNRLTQEKGNYFTHSIHIFSFSRKPVAIFILLSRSPLLPACWRWRISQNNTEFSNFRDY